MAAELAPKMAAEMVAENKAEELASLQKTLLHIIEGRFPALLEGARNVALPDSREELDALLVKVATAPHEQAACHTLGLPVD